MREARFIRHFTDDVTLSHSALPAFVRCYRALLHASWLALVDLPVEEVRVEESVLVGMRTTDGRTHRFHTL